MKRFLWLFLIAAPLAAQPPQFAGLLTNASVDYTCAGAAICSTWPMPANPGMGNNYLDPNWGTTTWELNIPSQNTEGNVIPTYSRVQGFSSDNSRLFLTEGNGTAYLDLYDATKYPPAPINRITTSDGTYIDAYNGDVQWSNTIPTRLYYIPWDSGSASLQLRYVDVSTCTTSSCVLTPTTVHTFSCTADSYAPSPITPGAACTTIETGSGGQGSMMDSTDTYFSFTGDIVNVNGRAEIDFIRYNKSTDTVTTQEKWYSVCTGGVPSGCGVWTDFPGYNMIRMNQHPNASYITVIWQCATTPNSAWEIGCGTAGYGPTYNFLGPISAGNYHQDNGYDVNGVPVWVGDDTNIGNPSDYWSLEVTNLTTLSTSGITSKQLQLPCSYAYAGTPCPTSPFLSAKGLHISMTGTWTTVPGYALISTYTLAGENYVYNVDFPLATTLGTAVSSAGSHTVTPASMAHIALGTQQLVDFGNANVETVTVTGVTGSTFTATFAKTHTSSAPVSNLTAGETGPFALENLAVKIDTTATSGSSASVWRLGRVMSIRDADYNAEAHTFVNRNWTAYVWGANWNTDGGTDNSYYTSLQQAPVCMYQDNLSGPASGGELGNGTYIDLFGLNFATPSVTVNGTNAAQIIYNGTDPTGDRSQLGIQVASGTSGTGAVVVSTGGGTCQYSTATISNVAVASGVATFAYTGPQLLAGQSLFVQGLSTTAGLQLDGHYIQVSATGLTSSAFEANTPWASNQSATSDSGTASNGGFTVSSGGIYYIGPGTNNTSASGYSCTTLKSSNSYSSPWQVANNPTGTPNYDLYTGLLTATPGTGYTTGSATIGSCTVGGSGMTASFEATTSGGLGNWAAISGGTGYSIGETCTATQGSNTTGTVTIWGWENNSYSYNQYYTPRTFAGCLSPGDTLVFLNGFSSLYGDGTNNHTALEIPSSGSSGSPITYMARPGATVTLGGQDTVAFGIRNGSYSAYINIFGITAVGSQSNGGAFQLSGPGTNNYIRAIGNTGSCPDCWASAAVFAAGQNAGAEQTTPVYLSVLGNYVTNASCELPAGVVAPASPAGVSNKQYHDFYLVGDSIEFAWNKVGNGTAGSSCAFNGMQFNYGTDNHTVGFTNIVAHDNDMSSVNGACLNYATVDPSRGYVLAYNNLLHGCGIQEAGDSIGAPTNHVCIGSPAEGAMGIALSSYSYSGGTLTLTGSTNSLSSGQSVTINTIVTTDPLYAIRGNTYSVLSTGLSSTQFEITESTVTGSGSTTAVANYASGTVPSATQYWFGNTMYDCSSIQNTVSTSQGCFGFPSGSQPTLTTNIVSNVCFQPTYTDLGTNTVWTNNAGSTTITGDHDLFYYAAGTPGNTNTSLPAFGTDGMLNSNPLFSTAADGPWTNYNLQSTSPAIGAGSTSLETPTDFVGFTRPNPPAIGALEYQNDTTYPLTISTTGTGSGTVSGSNCSTGSYVSGTAFTCSESPSAGSVFVGWSGGTCSGTGSCSGTITGATTIIATFNTAYTLTTSVSPTSSGTVSGTNCTSGTAYASGTSYSCTATAASGYAFSSWSSTCGGTGSGATYSGTMPTSNCSIEAFFGIIPSSTWNGISLQGVTIH